MIEELFVENLTHNQLLGIFVKSDISYPHRFQPFVTFKISFSEYVKFCELSLKVDYFVLNHARDEYVKAIRRGDEIYLKRLYYYDLSCVILNEVYTSIKYKKEGTVYLHTFDESSPSVSCNLSEIDKIVHLIDERAFNKAIMQIADKTPSFIQDAVISEHNQQLLNCAIIMRSVSLTKNPLQFEVKGR